MKIEALLLADEQTGYSFDDKKSVPGVAVC